MSTDKQNTDNELAMAILNGLSGPNACKASNINHNRMIPLHIADQAVAACDKEIAQLRVEVQRLRRRSEALREAGDELWFCLRHGKRLTHAEVQEAVEDWQDARGAE